jgi:hypothetical protein
MRWEEKLSLPSNTPAAEAKAQHSEWLAEIETRIATIRAAKAGTGHPLTRRNAHALAGEWYRWFIRQHEEDLRTAAYWKRLGDTLVWDVIYPHAPAEFLQDTKADPEWEWRLSPDVRAAVRPLIVQEARTASFLLERKISLNSEAMALFVDAVADNLLLAFTRLEAMSRGNFADDPIEKQFAEYAPVIAGQKLTCVRYSKNGKLKCNHRPVRWLVGRPYSMPRMLISLTRTL